MKMVCHNAARYYPYTILYGSIPKNAAEYDKVCICIEDDSAVDGDLEDVLEAF